MDRMDDRKSGKRGDLHTPSPDRDPLPEDITTQDDLDEALADTFPASDVPAPVSKGRPTRPRHPERRADGEKR
jgi:hypothetical protein